MTNLHAARVPAKFQFQFSILFQLTTDKCNSLLVQAICNILMKCKDDKYRIAYLLDHRKTADALSPTPSHQEEIGAAPDDALNAESSTDTGASRHSTIHPELEWSPDEFHERLSIHNFNNIDAVEKYYSDHFHVLSGNYGVLLFMYTVLMTKVSFHRTLQFSIYISSLEN